MSTARPLFLIALCGLVGSSARPGARPDSSIDGDPRHAMPHGARIHRETRSATSEPAGEGARSRLTKLLREAPEADLRALGAARASLLDLLPLDRLRDVHRGEHELVLEFDTGAGSVLEVQVPARTEHVIDEDAEEFDVERRGRAITSRTEPSVLLVHSKLRFVLDKEGIAGVREGDLEVRVGPFEVDVELRTERRASIARDRFGRPLIELDGNRNPVRRDGRWCFQHFERWIVLEALGHRVEIGVPELTALP